MSGRITGRIEVLVNNAMLLNKAGAVASGLGLSGEPNFELKPVNGDTGLHGFVEEPINAMLEVTITDRDDVKLSDLAKIRGNGTVIFRAAGGGKSYTMEGATCTRNFNITGGEGETPIKFVGAYWTESVQ
jgi:hypothetical protein